MSWETTLLHFISLNFKWFGQTEPIKVQNFRLSTAHFKIDQICTLIGSFYSRFIKFLLKKYRWVMSHDTEQWCTIWRKNNFLFKKWQELGKLCSEHSEALKSCTLIGPFRAKYKTFDLKMYRGLIFHDTDGLCKSWKKNLLVVWKMTWGIWQIFSWKCQNWNFHGILFTKVENTWAKNFTEKL